MDLNGKEIFLSFTCDPFVPSLAEATRKIIKAICSRGGIIRILTKLPTNYTKISKILFEYREKIKFGVTLTFNDLEKSREIEPNAESPIIRISILKHLKSLEFENSGERRARN